MFLQNGLNVNVSDGVERGRSSWAQFPGINEGEPMFQSYAERWTTYRLARKWACRLRAAAWTQASTISS